MSDLDYIQGQICPECVADLSFCLIIDLSLCRYVAKEPDSVSIVMTKTVPLGRGFYLILMSVFIAAGCAARSGDHPRPSVKKTTEAAVASRAKKGLARLGYAIQAGAFAKVENAARLTETLQAGGLNATYFVADQGAYKVQFGNFPSRQEARERAELLHAVGVIDVFYIVAPGEYTAARQAQYGDAYLREELIKTARRFIGVPYLWGGTSPDAGFDCSGLAMAVYQLNGLDLPRVSREQFEAGDPIEEKKLEKGDLVFFSSSGTGKISHVGIYAGDGQFIHAPGRGKNIRTDNLAPAYYRRHYQGGRSYL
jgi:cell wall-associated NlpC family hydrolase